MASNQVIVFDTTLRDGEQTPGVSLNLLEKLEIAKQLEDLGVDIIEAGFPAASPGDFEAVSGVAKAVNCGVAALCRCVPADIEKGWQALQKATKPRIHVFLATSAIHMKYKLRMEPAQVLEKAVASVEYAKSFCEDVEFSCEDASRSEPAFLYRILQAVIEAGATTINIPDTVGYALPGEFGQLIANIRANVPNIDQAVLSVHCHDDLGMATANTLAALKEGARQIETTINGIGERAGNCSMEEVIMTLATRNASLGLSHNIDTTRIYRTSQRVAFISGVPVPICKAVVGANAFAHESGIHQHGVLANPMTYEIMTPASVGKTESTLVLGKHSGRHAFEERLQQLGYKLAPAEINDAFARFKELADRKKNITDNDLDALVSQQLGEVTATYELREFQIQSGNQIKAMASVTLVKGGEEFSEAAHGEGPVDAAYNAARRIIGGDWPLASYDIRAITEGEDALGEVTVRVKCGDRLFTGKGLAPDIIESSIRAYIEAINRILAEMPEAVC